MWKSLWRTLKTWEETRGKPCGKSGKLRCRRNLHKPLSMFFVWKTNKLYVIFTEATKRGTSTFFSQTCFLCFYPEWHASHPKSCPKRPPCLFPDFFLPQRWTCACALEGASDRCHSPVIQGGLFLHPDAGPLRIELRYRNHGTERRCFFRLQRPIQP